MKVMLVKAQNSINNQETWLYYYPTSYYRVTKYSKGLAYTIMPKRHRIERNILKDINNEWFITPVDLYFKKDKYGIVVISKIKNGDKIIK